MAEIRPDVQCCSVFTLYNIIPVSALLTDVTHFSEPTCSGEDRGLVSTFGSLLHVSTPSVCSQRRGFFRCDESLLHHRDDALIQLLTDKEALVFSTDTIASAELRSDLFFFPTLNGIFSLFTQSTACIFKQDFGVGLHGFDSTGLFHLWWNFFFFFPVTHTLNHNQQLEACVYVVVKCGRVSMARAASLKLKRHR